MKIGGFRACALFRYVKLPEREKDMVIMMKRRNFVAAMLTLSLLSVSCASGGTGGGTSSGDISGGDASQSGEVTSDPNADAVPKLDFGGAEVRTIQQDTTRSFYVEDAVGDVVNDAIYERNRKIEERFNVKFTPTIMQKYNAITTSVTQAVLSETYEYDIIFGQMFETASLASQGLCADWNTIPYLDFDKPWYTKSIQQSSIGDKLYMIESDACLSYTEHAYVMVFNQTLLEEYQGMPDFYGLVRDGKWTLDKMGELASGMYVDINGDSRKDSEDRYGFGCFQGTGGPTFALMYGAGLDPIKINDDLTIENSMDSEFAINRLTKISELLNKNDGTVHGNGRFTVGFYEESALFRNRTLVIAPVKVGMLVGESFRKFEDNYGVLPFPKYDETQSEYDTIVDGGANILSLQKNIPDESAKMVGALVEALSAESHNSVVPKLCDIALEQKGVRDDESAEMLRLALDNRVMNFGFLYDCSKGWVMKLPKILENPSAVTSTVASFKDMVTEYYTGVVNFLTEN